jgi:NitT/TauT family transport system substrate-binding protein
MSDPPVIADTSITFVKAGSIDILLPKLLNGDIDIGILPPNVAAKIHSKSPNSIEVASVVGNGMLSIITRDTAVSRLEDLSGKTVYVAGQGSTPEYVMRTLLARKGIREGSIRLDYSIPYQEIAPSLLSGKIQYALVPEPFATVAIMAGGGVNPVRRAILLRDAWKDAGLGEEFPMTLCVVRKAYAARNPEAVTRFLAAYRASVEWTVAHPVEAGSLVEAQGLGLKADVAARAIPSCNFVWIDAKDARKGIEALLGVFLEYAPESVGGTLPDGGFYRK